MIVLFKAHNRGYVRSTGVVVKPFEDKRVKHPKPNDQGHRVTIKHPHKDSDLGDWFDPDQTATVTPGGHIPDELNDIPIERWTNRPDWSNLKDVDIGEPEFRKPKLKHPAAGIVITEDDGRVWLVHPSNAFSGYKATFPKGTQENGLSLQATAVKEVFEESGIHAKITGFIADVERSGSVTRYYSGKRVGGDPSAMGWETQAVSLVPKDQLKKILNQKIDHALVDKISGNQ